MNEYPHASTGTPELITQFQVPDFEVSWAGAAPSDGGVFCFGGENGRVITTEANGERRMIFPEPFCNGEPINGIAFKENQWMAVSSRDQLSLCEIENGIIHTCDVLAGSHGVVHSPNGYFYSPLGINGYLSWMPQRGDRQSISINNSDNPANIYSMHAIRSLDNKLIIACAARKKGIGRIEQDVIKQDAFSQVSSFGHLDVVDVTPLRMMGNDGFAAIGIDNTIVFYKHVAQEEDPLCMRFDEIRGVAYRIVAIRGLLCILTSKALYIIDKLIQNKLMSVEKDIHGNVLALPMEAVDVNPVRGRWLIVTLNDRVLRIDLDYLGTATEVPPYAAANRYTNGTTIQTSLNRSPVYSAPTWVNAKQEVRSRNSASLNAAIAVGV